MGKECPPIPKSKVINPNTQQVDGGPQDRKLTTFLLSCYITVLPPSPPISGQFPTINCFIFLKKNEHTEFYFPYHILFCDKPKVLNILRFAMFLQNFLKNKFSSVFKMQYYLNYALDWE